MLPKTTQLVGFPDAGFFLDAKNIDELLLEHRELFQGADPVWNVTGSGGTNKACLKLAANRGMQWKCLMAEYIVPRITTPLFVLNSAYDAYQLPNILQTPCPVSTEAKRCNDTAAEAYGTLLK